jgi:hypothetical protein
MIEGRLGGLPPLFRIALFEVAGVRYPYYDLHRYELDLKAGESALQNSRGYLRVVSSWRLVTTVFILFAAIPSEEIRQ